MSIRALPTLLLALPAALASSLREDAPAAPPGLGTVAQSVEPVNWLYAGPDGRVPKIHDLRGQVVLVHTWGYYCGPCMRVGVPYVVDLMEAQRENGLRAYSITVPVSDDKAHDHFVKVGREVGMDHPLGYADGFGGMSPYVNMNVNKGLTWCFVIGREGGVRWAGDPSIDGEEFLAAVHDALLEEAPPPLPERVPDALAPAVRLYVTGDLARAAEEAEKTRAKHARKVEDAAEAAVAAAAADLIASIADYEERLSERLAAALAAQDAAAYAAARRALVARFPKTPAAKHAGELDRKAKANRDFQREIDRWEEWSALRREAPVLFPARADRDGKRYAKKLSTYLERAGPDAPGREEGERMLAAFREEG